MKTTNKEYDIHILGAGLAELLWAWSLRRMGRRVLVVERNETIKMNGADILKPSGIAVLKEMDLLEKLLRKDSPMRNGLSVFHNGVRTTPIDYRAEHTRGYFLTLLDYSVSPDQGNRLGSSVAGCLENVDPQTGSHGKTILFLSTGDAIAYPLLGMRLLKR